MMLAEELNVVVDRKVRLRLLHYLPLVLLNNDDESSPLDIVCVSGCVCLRFDPLAAHRPSARIVMVGRGNGSFTRYVTPVLRGSGACAREAPSGEPKDSAYLAEDMPCLPMPPHPRPCHVGVI